MIRQRHTLLIDLNEEFSLLKNNGTEYYNEVNFLV